MCQSFDAGSTYQGIQDKIRDLVPSRVSMGDSGLSPMDVGAAGDDYTEGEVDQYFGAIGKGFRECCGCGEQGHFARVSSKVCWRILLKQKRPEG